MFVHKWNHLLKQQKNQSSPPQNNPSSRRNFQSSPYKANQVIFTNFQPAVKISCSGFPLFSCASFVWQISPQSRHISHTLHTPMWLNHSCIVLPSYKRHSFLVTQQPQVPLELKYLCGASACPCGCVADALGSASFLSQTQGTGSPFQDMGTQNPGTHLYSVSGLLAAPLPPALPQLELRYPF